WMDNSNHSIRNDLNRCRIDFVVAFDRTCSKVCSITARLTEFGVIHETELSNGADIKVSTTGTCQAFVKFDSFSTYVDFPLAIDPKKLKTRIARKSKYIEVRRNHIIHYFSKLYRI